MFVRIKNTGAGNYLYLVESRRDKDTVRQYVVASLGRLGDLQKLEGLQHFFTQLVSHCPPLRQQLRAERLGPFIRKLTAPRPDLREPWQEFLNSPFQVYKGQTWGPTLALEPMWETCGLKAAFLYLPDTDDPHLFE